MSSVNRRKMAFFEKMACRYELGLKMEVLWDTTLNFSRSFATLGEINGKRSPQQKSMGQLKNELFHATVVKIPRKEPEDSAINIPKTLPEEQSFTGNEPLHNMGCWGWNTGCTNVYRAAAWLIRRALLFLHSQHVSGLFCMHAPGTFSDIHLTIPRALSRSSIVPSAVAR